MKGKCFAVLFFCLTFISSKALGKETFKSPNGKKSVVYSCTNSKKMMNCSLDLIEGKKKTNIHKMKFSSSTMRELGYEAGVTHFCKVAWGPDSKKLVFYCYYNSNFETEIYSDDNVFLYLYTLGGNKTELRKGGLNASWTLGKASNSDSCLGEKDFDWGYDKSRVFLKFDGKTVTYHVKEDPDYENDQSYAFCEKLGCSEPNYYGCGGPATSIISTITQDVNTKKITSKKNSCYMYYVCD